MPKLQVIPRLAGLSPERPASAQQERKRTVPEIRPILTLDGEPEFGQIIFSTGCEPPEKLQKAVLEHRRHSTISIIEKAMSRWAWLRQAAGQSADGADFLGLLRHFQATNRLYVCPWGLQFRFHQHPAGRPPNRECDNDRGTNRRGFIPVERIEQATLRATPRGTLVSLITPSSEIILPLVKHPTRLKDMIAGILPDKAVNGNERQGVCRECRHYRRRNEPGNLGHCRIAALPSDRAPPWKESTKAAPSGWRLLGAANSPTRSKTGKCHEPQPYKT